MLQPHAVGDMNIFNRSTKERENKRKREGEKKKSHQCVKCFVGTDLEDLEKWNNQCEGAGLGKVMQDCKQ